MDILLKFELKGSLGKELVGPGMKPRWKSVPDGRQGHEARSNTDKNKSKQDGKGGKPTRRRKVRSSRWRRITCAWSRKVLWRRECLVDLELVVWKVEQVAVGEWQLRKAQKFVLAGSGFGGGGTDVDASVGVACSMVVQSEQVETERVGLN